MNDLQKIFKYQDRQVRALRISEVPWFVGKDVAEILGYSKPANALTRHVDDEDKIMGVQNVTPYIVDRQGRKQYPTLINESGLYSLILSSKLPSAKEFKHWITSEVLPQIRKTGKYAPKPLSREELLAKAVLEADTMIKEQKVLLEQKTKELEETNNKLEEQKPKVIFAESVVASDSAILIRELAHLIKQNGFEIGEKRLYAWMRERGYICKGSCEPTQRALELGLFEIIVRTVQRGDKSPLETRTTKVTGKGQVYFINKFCGGRQDEDIEDEESLI